MNRRLAIAFFLLAALLLCRVGAALADPVTEARARVAKRARANETIQADFVQEKRLSVFDEVVTSHGTFLYERPDRLRWEITEPVKAGFLLTGSEGRRWHELLKEDEAFSLDADPALGAVASQLMAWASADFTELEATYKIELVSNTPTTFRLTPLSEGLGKYLDRIEVAFAPDERYVTRVTVREKSGDATTMTFSNVRLGEPLPEKAFSR